MKPRFHTGPSREIQLRGAEGRIWSGIYTMQSTFDTTDVTTCCRDAFTNYMKAIQAYVGLNGDIVGACKQAIASDATFVLANVLLGAIYAFGNVDPASPLQAPILAVLSNPPSNATDRERRLAKVAIEMAHGRLLQACIILERLVFEIPNDMLALKLLADCYFYTGASERTAHVVDVAQWKEIATPISPLYRCYGYALAIRSFGLLEIGELEEGNAAAQSSLTINRGDIWGIHARAHYFEMSKQYNLGVQWLESVRQNWAVPSGALYMHLCWHLALLYIGIGQIDKAFQIFTTEILPNINGIAMNLADASSLLWRLELRGRTVEQAWWDELSTQWRVAIPAAWSGPQISPNTYPFNICHMALTLSKSSHPEDRQALEFLIYQVGGFAAIQEFVPLKDQTNLHHTAATTANICDSVVAFAENRWVDCVSHFISVKKQLQTIGGSTPQRAIFAIISDKACSKV